MSFSQIAWIVAEREAHVRGQNQHHQIMNTNQTPPEGTSSANPLDLSALHGAACSLLPVYAALSSTGNEHSWVVKTASLISDGDLAPGIDIVLGLENSHGVFNNLRVSLRIPWKANAPVIVEECCMNYLASIQWGETQIMDGVLLSFRRPEFLAELFVDLAAHMKSLGKIFLANVKVRSPLTGGEQTSNQKEELP